jgi:hypothetical protein
MRTNEAGRRSWVLALAVAVVAGPGGAAVRASGYISFDLNPQGGTGRIAYTAAAAGAAGNGVVGSNLSVADVKGVGTPQHSGDSLAVTQGVVNFSTGPFTGTGTITPSSVAKEWQFAPGGSLTVTGGIAALGVAPGTPLLTGTFTDPTFVRPLSGTTDLKVQGGALMTLVNYRLASYLGLPVGSTVSYVGGISTFFAATGTAPGSFSSDGYTSGYVTTTPVPEPGALAVFALAVGCGLAWMRRVHRPGE